MGKQPRRETLLSCSGNERAAMIQLNEPMPERLYENADAIYYVLGGEGTLMLNGKEMKLGLNGFASVPRGTSHSFSKRGNRLLVLLSVLSGEPCEAGALAGPRPGAVGVEREADEVRRLIGTQQQRRVHEHQRIAAV